jgi:hypothetical protein
MSIDQQIFDFMPHTVTIAAFSNKNNYGEDVQTTTRTARAYVEPNVTMREDAQTMEETRPLRAYIADTAITIRDRITLPDGSSPEIASIEIHTVVPGLYHTVVSFR